MEDRGQDLPGALMKRSPGPGGVALGALAMLAAGAHPARAQQGSHVGIVQKATGLSSPTRIAAPGDGSDRLFIVERGGRIRIWNGSLLPTPFLDITPLVISGGEQGLLGLAFHQSYEVNGFFFVNY